MAPTDSETEAGRPRLPADMVFTPTLPTRFILQQLPLLTNPSAPREALLDHLGVCMSGAYGTSAFPGAGCVQRLFSSKITISTLYVLVGAISRKTVELYIKAVFRNNLVITSAGGHQ